ncbi:MAG TPA: TPM domain-containing protein [Thermoanaerobaculia bacterium]|nr:TPM domain-containing protein [Thermoanaerobaculia bacterium]
MALLAAAALAQPVPPPTPDRWVLDEAGFLSPGARATLDAELEAFEGEQGSQVLVAIFRELPAGTVLEEWTQRVAESWRVGRARQDDGAVLFLFLADRQVRLEVGYGLEGALTDLEASRILREQLIPQLRTGDRDAALLAAGRAILAAIEGEYEPGPGAERGPSEGLPLWGILLLAVAVLLLLSVAGRAGGWRGGPGAGSSGWPGGGGFPGGRIGGGGFSGGGFSGGGGSFGGGGASGRW